MAVAGCHGPHRELERIAGASKPQGRCQADPGDQRATSANSSLYQTKTRKPDLASELSREPAAVSDELDRLDVALSRLKPGFDSLEKEVEALRRKYFYRPQLMAELESQLDSVCRQLVGLDHSDRMFDILKASENRLETDIKSLRASV